MVALTGVLVAVCILGTQSLWFRIASSVWPTLECTSSMYALGNIILGVVTALAIMLAASFVSWIWNAKRP